MSDTDFHDFELTVYMTVTAPSLEEATEAVVRSGITSGTVIGECLVETYDLEEL